MDRAQSNRIPRVASSLESVGRGSVVAVNARVAGGDGVEHQQENIWRARRWKRSGVFSDLSGVIAIPHRTSEDGQDDEWQRESGKEEGTKSPAVTFDDRNDPDGDSGRNQQQGRAINLRKHREDRRENCAGGERASEEPAAAVRPNRHDREADHSQRDEDAKVGNGDQPSEVVAEPEGPVRIEEMLAKEDGTDLQQTGDQPAPDGQRDIALGAWVGMWEGPDLSSRSHCRCWDRRGSNRSSASVGYGARVAG